MISGRLSDIAILEILKRVSPARTSGSWLFSNAFSGSQSRVVGVLKNLIPKMVENDVQCGTKARPFTVVAASSY